MSIEDFWKSNVVNNVASFLGIPKSKIRVSNIIKESKRKRREASANDTMELILEIGDAPSEDLSADPSNDTLDYEALKTISSKIEKEAEAFKEVH